MSQTSFENLHRVAEQVQNIVVGKKEQIRQALVCILAGGHLLIEDVPGVGKTTLSHALAISLGLNFTRLQFTSDMLPSDVTGSAIYERSTSEFVFHPGPVFTQVLLADEINRATPKTQSSLLEAMEEGQVSIEGVTHSLPKPFIVIATQNPSHQVGTFALPESQLDRFLMSISVGYPDAEAEELLLMGSERRTMLKSLRAVMSPEQLIDAQSAIDNIHVSAALASYVRKLLTQSRQGEFVDGLSPRAGLALLRAARAWTALAGRDHVTPGDVQAVFLPVVSHRLHTAVASMSPAAAIDQLLKSVPV